MAAIAKMALGINNSLEAVFFYKRPRKTNLMNTLCQEIQFSAVPGSADPMMLRNSYQKKLKSSLLIYLQNLSKSTQIDLSSQITKISSLDFQRRFSPSLYAFYVQLKEAYDSKDLEALLDSIQLLNIETQESLYADELVCGTTLSEYWERPFMKELRESLPIDDNNSATTNKIFPLVHWNKEDFPPPAFTQSFSILKELDYPLFLEADTYVSRIKMYSSRTLHSVTSPRYFGAVYIRLPFSSEDPELFFLETFVHEVSHLHLFTLMNADTLILNNEQDMFTSPLRTDRRPMMGVFHAVFVLSRMARILRKYNTQQSLELLKKRKIAFEEGLSTIVSYAQLTEKGKELLQTLELCAFE